MRSLALRGLAFRRTDDETLMARVRQGDDAAFAELYRRHRSLVYGYCLARLMDPHAAEDVTQDVFMRINRARSAEEVRSARAWIFSVARSAIIDHVRHRNRRLDSVTVEEGFDVEARDSDAATGMFRREDAKAVFLALARLRPRYRSALILREMHGLSSVEIGEVMQLKAGAVDTLVCRARDAFGREYAAVSDLGADCRRAVEYLYREKGTGIEPGERSWLDEHVSSCVCCAKERSLAGDPRRLSMLVPLAGIRVEGLAILNRAWESLGAAPASNEAFSAFAVKVTTLAVAATVAFGPAAAMPEVRAPQVRRSTLPRVVVVPMPLAPVGIAATPGLLGDEAENPSRTLRETRETKTPAISGRNPATATEAVHSDTSVAASDSPPEALASTVSPSRGETSATAPRVSVSASAAAPGAPVSAAAATPATPSASAPSSAPEDAPASAEGTAPASSESSSSVAE